MRNDARIGALREAVDEASARLGRRLAMLIAKPGLDGHSNGAEQLALRARDAGVAVVYEGIRFSPDEIVAAALTSRPHIVGLSVLSGGHVRLAKEIARKLSQAGLGETMIVAGGIIPAEDEAALKAAGVAAIFTPKDFDLDAIMRKLIGLALER
jgi:(2R)-ethylmalonyl-CoA mutase